jgi:glycerol dehydrogenase
MNHIASFPGKYIQGSGAIRQLEELISQFGSKAIILTSPSAGKHLPEKYLHPPLSDQAHIERFGGECSEEELERIAGRIQQQQADVMVGMGGGKVIDAAKIAADRAGMPVIIVPTIASTDAPCSGCAVTYTPDGVFEKVHYQRSNPTVVLVDTDIMAKAPHRFLVAGMGDALATWFEARSCAKTTSVNECGGLGTKAGLHLAKLCYDLLLDYGLQAKLDNQAGKVSDSLDNIIEANILLSGIGFESGGLAAAHAIHNGLTALPETHAFYHGEKVAFGLLAGLHMMDAPVNELNEVYGFCKAVGLPVTLAELGISADNKSGLMQVAQKSAEKDSPIHHEGSDITPEKVYDALLRADAFGRQVLSGEGSNMLFPVEGYLDIADMNVWYRIAGRGNNTPLLLLHGGPGISSHYLEPLAELASDRPVIFFDQPGCGRSDRVKDITKVDIPYFVNALEALRQKLGLKQFYLYGQSWGSLLALEYYLEHPEGVKALIFSSPLISTPAWIRDADLLIRTLPPETRDAILKNEAAGTVDSPEYQQAMMVFYERFVARKLPWSDDFQKSMEQMALEIYNHMWGPSEFTVTGLLRTHDRSESLKDIRVPVLYLCGEFDEARPETIRQFHTMTPDSKMHVVPGAAHLTMHDAPGVDAGVIRGFLGALRD